MINLLCLKKTCKDDSIMQEYPSLCAMEVSQIFQEVLMILIAAKDASLSLISFSDPMYQDSWSHLSLLSVQTDVS